MTARPIVILTGWLGCQPRSLRRYEELYRRLGFEVQSYIAPPTAVFECSLPYYTPKRGLDNHQRFEMHELVDQIIDDLQRSDCPTYLFHCFSNGGCFVWEAFRQATPTPPVGVIMDSCPAFQIHRVTMALDYCTMRERLHVAWKYGRYFWRAQNHDSWQPQVQHRAEQYKVNLRDDPWLVPQLFLYSMDDRLMPHQEIQSLAQARRERGVPVTERVWKHSRHCAHLIDHPHQYEESVSLFVKDCFPVEVHRRAML